MTLWLYMPDYLLLLRVDIAQKLLIIANSFLCCFFLILEIPKWPLRLIFWIIIFFFLRHVKYAWLHWKIVQVLLGWVTWSLFSYGKTTCARIGAILTLFEKNDDVPLSHVCKIFSWSSMNLVLGYFSYNSLSSSLIVTSIFFFHSMIVSSIKFVLTILARTL